MYRGERCWRDGTKFSVAFHEKHTTLVTGAGGVSFPGARHQRFGGGCVSSVGFSFKKQSKTQRRESSAGTRSQRAGKGACGHPKESVTTLHRPLKKKTFKSEFGVLWENPGNKSGG